MKHKQSLPLPLELVKNFEKDYPACWDMADYVRKGKGIELPDWNDLCYCPLAGAEAIMIKKYHEKDINKASLLVALASWRQYKEIYSFSDELKETLYEQNDDIVIPTEVLYNIPFPCIYIATDNDEGFFVFFEYDVNTLQMELRLCLVSKTKPLLNMWVHLKEGYTISDGIIKGINLAIENQKKYPDRISEDIQNIPFDFAEVKQYYMEEITKRFQLILYICSDNAEIEENPQQKQITRKPSQNSKPKDVYREIRSWDVGVKYAHNVRKANLLQEDSVVNQEISLNKTHKSPRPHTRRGHWHHYWTGTKNNRKLILKWTAPIFVGGSSDDIITTINKI